MEDPKVIKAVSKWFLANFKIDKKQELNLICPKPLIINLACKHDFGFEAFTELGIKRCIDTILKETISKALHEQPSKNIDTVANYTLQDSDSPDRVRKIRCFRYIFPKPSMIISPEDRSDFAKFFNQASQNSNGHSASSSTQANTVVHPPNQPHKPSVDTASPIQLQLDTIVGTNNEDIVMIELFAGEATAIQQAHLNAPNRVKSLAVDKLLPELCGATKALKNDNSAFDQANLRYASPNDITAWCSHHLNTSPDKINRVHASIPCQTYVIIDQCNSAPHRDKEGKALSDQARAHDELLINVINVIQFIIAQNPAVFITIENPAHGFFHKQASIQNLLYQPGWHHFIMDHCAAASAARDGKVHGPAFHRKGGLFSKKPTFWLCYNIIPPHPLPRCLGRDCRMTVPGYDHHVLIVSNTTGNPRYGQRRMDSTAKSRIPLGAHEILWNAHQDWLSANINHHSECAVCGSDSGSVLKCSCSSCRRVQHPACSFAAESSPAWLCNTCFLLDGRCSH